MIVGMDALEAELGASGMAERRALLAEGGRFAAALRLAEERPWPAAEMLADLWRWALWLVMVRGRRGQTTGARYVGAVMRWGGWCAEHGVDYREATLDELDAFVRWMYAGLRLSPSARAVTIVAVRSFYAWRSSRRGGRNCAAELRVPRRPRRMPRKYTPGQLRKLFAAAEKSNYGGELTRVRDRAILLLLYSAGLRREELCTLRLADVTIETARIATVRVFGKGAKERVVAVEGPVVNALAEWIQLRTQSRHARLPELFCSVGAEGGALQPTGLERIVKRTAQRAGLTHWGVHMFRVTFATQLYDEGVDLERIRIVMGHESIETTRGYIAVSNRQRSVRLPAHRQHAALGTMPEGLPRWAKQLEEGK